ASASVPSRALLESTSSRPPPARLDHVFAPGHPTPHPLTLPFTTLARSADYSLPDTLSGAQTFGSVTNAGSYTCTGTGPVVCTLPSGTLPGTYTLTYTTTVDANASGTVGNSVAGTVGGDPTPTCTACTTTHTVALPEITSSTSRNPATGLAANPGDTILYTFSSTVAPAAMTAVFPYTTLFRSAQTFGSVTNAGSYTCTGTGPVVCTLPSGTLPGTYTLTYT